MPCEVKDWKAVDCVLEVEISRLSDRETYSREINEIFGEGGGLNANYRLVEAVAVAANILGFHGFRYGEHFRFKTGGLDVVRFDFSDLETMARAREILANVSPLV